MSKYPFHSWGFSTYKIKLERLLLTWGGNMISLDVRTKHSVRVTERLSKEYLLTKSDRLTFVDRLSTYFIFIVI